MSNSESYTLFLDESGKSHLCDDGDILYLCGVIISKDLHTALSQYMISLKGKSKIAQNNNIHAFDLLENEKIRGRGKRIPYKRIDKFFNRFIRLVEGSDMQVIIVSLDKRAYVDRISRLATRKKTSIKTIERFLKREGLNDFLYETLVRKLILQFGHFLDKQGSTGDIVAESRRDGDHAVVNGFMHATNQATYLPNTINRMWAQQSFDHIYGLTFQNKKGLSYGLEVADMIAWTILNKDYLNKHKQLPRTPSSKTKQSRIVSRINTIHNLLPDLMQLYTKKTEIITNRKLKSISPDLVSEFTNLLKKYRNTES